MSKKSEIEKNKRLARVIRDIAREVAYEVLDEHLEEKHRKKTLTEIEIENEGFN